MAVSQYIGARYVPLFADPMQWDSTKTYEPLTIVYNGGNSYTSRQYVPAGIQIDDDAYWALTGNYNAQIEQYRAEVAQCNGRIEAVNGRIEAVEGDTTQLKTDMAGIDDTLTAITPLDAVPTVNSSKGITSDGVYKALQTTAKSIKSVNDTLTAITPLDAVPTMNSTKGVTSDGVYKALQATVESTRKCIVVIGDSWVMTDPNDTTKPYYSHWLTLFKNRYPDNVFFTRYADTTATTIIRTKQEIDILAANDSFKNADVTDVLMIAGLNGGTSADAISVAAYARKKFNGNLTFTWAQDCYTPLRAIYGGKITSVDATSYIKDANSTTNNKYIDLSSVLMSPHFFSNDSNNVEARGAKIIGFHMSQTGSQRLFSFFADYFFTEHLGAWGKQPFNAENFNSCFYFGNSAGNRYDNTAVSVDSTFVDYERGTFKLGFYSGTPYTHLAVCNFVPVSNTVIPTLQLPLVPSGVVHSAALDGDFFKAFGNMFFGVGSKSGLTLMEGKMADASFSTTTFFLGA